MKSLSEQRRLELQRAAHAPKPGIHTVAKASVDPTPVLAPDAAFNKLRTLAAQIQALTAAGPGQVTQAALDSLHAQAQLLITAKKRK